MANSLNRTHVPAAWLLFGLMMSSTQAVAQTADAPKDLWHRGELLGSIAGLRPALKDTGIEFNLTDIETAFGNPTGGTRRSVAFQGLVTAELELDTAKAFGWQGGTFHISGEQLHGIGLTTLSLNNLNTVTSVADPAQTSLFELWYDQSFAGSLADVRIGRQVASKEFLLNRYEDPFINSAFGWPTLNAEDLPSGGPDYPYAFTGIKLALHPSKEILWSGGIYDSNYAGAGFSFRGGLFAVTELDISHGEGKHSKILPGTIKLGAWYDSNAFADQHISVDGLSLADPAAPQAPLLHSGDEAAYVSIDQIVYRRKPGSIGVFGRVMVAPGDRNLVDLFADSGVVMTGLLPGRKNDTIVAGLGYARISRARQVFDIDVRHYTGAPYPIASAETFIEIGYKAEITPWWQVQPDFQYIFNPGGGIPDSSRGNRKIPDAAVLGVQSIVKF